MNERSRKFCCNCESMNPNAPRVLREVNAGRCAVCGSASLIAARPVAWPHLSGLTVPRPQLSHPPDPILREAGSQRPELLDPTSGPERPYEPIPSFVQGRGLPTGLGPRYGPLRTAQERPALSHGPPAVPECSDRTNYIGLLRSFLLL